MRGRFMRGLAAGAFLGAAAGMLLMPNMDKRTKRRFVKAGRRISEFTEDLFDGLKEIKR